MYVRHPEHYDAIYASLGKDYAREAQTLHEIITRESRSSGRALLDVACGTGGHITYLKTHYAVEGLDRDAGMLNVARRRHPDVPFHQGDMMDFHLGRTFDVVTCLFSAIAYALTVPLLRQAIGAMARHVRQGGLVIVEPFIAPERWRDRHVAAAFVDEPDLKIARMNIGRREGRIATLEFHYLVATPDGVEHYTERHDLALHTHQEYLDAFRAAGLDVHHDAEGLMGRGLYVGRRPSSPRVDR